MAMIPRAEQLDIPDLYGRPTQLMDWPAVEEKLAAARHYWIATVRPDGRPHVVPHDGLWLDSLWYFGGSAETVKHRSLIANGRAVLHLEDAASAVIVEGECRIESGDEALAERLSSESRRKYGSGPPPAVYLGGVWVLTPRRVFAWTDLTSDATRFVFD